MYVARVSCNNASQDFSVQSLELVTMVLLFLHQNIANRVLEPIAIVYLKTQIPSGETFEL